MAIFIQHFLLSLTNKQNFTYLESITSNILSDSLIHTFALISRLIGLRPETIVTVFYFLCEIQIMDFSNEEPLSESIVGLKV